MLLVEWSVAEVSFQLCRRHRHQPRDPIYLLTMVQVPGSEMSDNGGSL